MFLSSIFSLNTFVGFITGFIIGIVLTITFVLRLGHKALTENSIRQNDVKQPEDKQHIFLVDAFVHCPPSNDYKGGYTEVRVCSLCSSVENISEDDKTKPCFNCKVSNAFETVPGVWSDADQCWIGTENKIKLKQVRNEDNYEQE